MSAIPRDVTTNVTNRTEVYKAIDTERDFQDQFVLPERRYYQTHTLGEFVLMLNQYAAQAMQKWTHHSDGDSPDNFPLSLHEVRKIAAIAVRCMEQHGAPCRVVEPKEEEVPEVDLDELLNELAKEEPPKKTSKKNRKKK